MKFKIQAAIYRDFGELNVGEIFLDDESTPYIKILEVCSTYNRDIYNCVRLSDGMTQNFHCNEQVRIPIDYKFEIKM